MNMKKTIAAVAAGAMAVSAMATSVSALEDQTVSYNLTQYFHSWSTPKITYTFSVTNVPAAGGLTVTDVDDWAIKSVTIRIVDDDNPSDFRIYTYSTDINSVNYAPTRVGAAGITLDNELNFGTGLTKSVFFTVDEEVWPGGNNQTSDANTHIGTHTPTASAGNPTPATLSAYTGTQGGLSRIPFKTGPSGNENIVYYLQNAEPNAAGEEQVSLRGEWDGVYRNVLPVINDAIANYDTVTFTFHTAAGKIGFVIPATASAGKATKDLETADYNFGNVYTKGHKAGDNAAGTVEAALVAVGGDKDRLLAIYTDKDGADNSYTSFTQHLYNGTNDYYGAGPGWGGYAEGYLGFDWAGQNLFGGALVINENLTMSLSDVDYFNWQQDTLSFDWDAIMDSAATSNGYATYLQSLKLATSVDWYWDSMDVVLVAGDGEGDDVASDAGTTSEEEVLDEEDTDAEEITDEEAPADEEEEAPAEEAEETPVQANPGTGNAPVALAVIPVALAAAAVVAKKRG